MANLSTHLFQLINDVPVYCPVQLNIPCFRELYIRDTTPDKSEYAKQLAFIYYFHDYNSPFQNVENKKEECLQAAFGNKNYKISDLLQECMDRYVKTQSTPEKRSLDAMIEMLNDLLKSLSSMKKSTEEKQRYLDDIEKQLRKEEDLDVRRKLILMQDEAMLNFDKASGAVTELIPKIAKVIKEMVDLRKVVAESILQMDSSSNKEDISNHIIYEIIDQNRNYV